MPRTLAPHQQMLLTIPVSDVKLSAMPKHTGDNQIVNRHMGQVRIISCAVEPPADRVGALVRQGWFHPEVSVQLIICVVIIFTVRISNNSRSFIRLIQINKLAHSSRKISRTHISRWSCSRVSAHGCNRDDRSCKHKNKKNVLVPCLFLKLERVSD